MRNFVIPPPAPISIAIANSDDKFPVRRVYCVGRNYAEHVKEMGGDPKTSAPTFFTKSREAIVPNNSILPYPVKTKDCHFEAELVVAMASPTDIFGYAAGLDMTRRDLQAAAKVKGSPWDMAKNFDSSAPCAAIVPVARASKLADAGITLTQNGETRQSSTLAHMIWSVSDIIDHLGNLVTLAAGDIIFTGTPSGVGPISAGDHLQVTITGLPALNIYYA